MTAAAVRPPRVRPRDARRHRPAARLICPTPTFPAALLAPPSTAGRSLSSRCPVAALDIPCHVFHNNHPWCGLPGPAIHGGSFAHLAMPGGIARNPVPRFPQQPSLVRTTRPRHPWRVVRSSRDARWQRSKSRATFSTTTIPGADYPAPPSMAGRSLISRCPVASLEIPCHVFHNNHPWCGIPGPAIHGGSFAGSRCPVASLEIPAHPLRLSISPTLMVARLRNSTSRIARPMAASAAATVSTKNTNTCPLGSPR